MRPKTEYRDALITYIDILGFGEMVERSTADPLRVGVIRSILDTLHQESTRGWTETDEQGNVIPLFFADHFSDTFLRTTFIGRTALIRDYVKSEMRRLAHIQSTLTSFESILLRGGIARGKLYREPDGNFIFGPALIRAYKLAEDLAVYPRILIDADIVELLEDNKEPWHQYRRCGDDGAYFIDYLKAAYIEKWEFDRISKDTIPQSLLAHKIVAENKLDEFGKRDDHLRRKALWLAHYHNSTVKRIVEESPELQEELHQYLIPEEKLLA